MVEGTRVQNKNANPAPTILNMYSNKIWEKLPVNLSGEDSKYLYFTAKVSGLSFFCT